MVALYTGVGVPHSCLPKKDYAHQSVRDEVGVKVRGRAAILQEAFPVIRHQPRNSDGGVAVLHSPPEVAVGGGAEPPLEPADVVSTAAGVADAQKLQVRFLQLLYGSLNVSEMKKQSSESDKIM